MTSAYIRVGTNLYQRPSAVKVRTTDRAETQPIINEAGGWYQLATREWVEASRVALIDDGPSTPPPQPTEGVIVPARTVLYQRPGKVKRIKTAIEQVLPYIGRSGDWIQVGPQLWAAANKVTVLGTIPVPPPPAPPPEPPPPPSGITMMRLINDVEDADWNYMSRTNPNNPLNWRATHPKMHQAPAAIRVHLMRPNGKAGPSQFTMPAVWQKAIAAWQYSAQAFGYLTRRGSGWVNRPDWPTVQVLLFRNNPIPIEGQDGDRCFIWHYSTEEQPPESLAHLMYPQAFTVVREDGKVLFPDPPGVVAWMPLVFPMDVWIESRYLSTDLDGGKFMV